MPRSHQELLAAGIRHGHEYLDSFGELEEDWDGESGEPVEPKTIALAHKIMDVVGDDKFICPTNEGEVHFEWDEPNGDSYIVTVLYLTDVS